MDFSNRALVVGMTVALHKQRDASGRVIGTVSKDDLNTNPVLSGIVKGYDSIGMLIEFEPGYITLMQWDQLASYRMVFEV